MAASASLTSSTLTANRIAIHPAGLQAGHTACYIPHILM
jgi:hypothetical protein